MYPSIRDVYAGSFPDLKNEGAAPCAAPILAKAVSLERSISY